MTGIRSIKVEAHVSEDGDALGGSCLGLDGGDGGHVDEVEGGGVVDGFAGAGGVEGAGFGGSSHQLGFEYP